MSQQFSSGINGQPFLCLDPYLGDLAPLELGINEVMQKMALCQGWEHLNVLNDYQPDKRSDRHSLEYIQRHYGVLHTRHLLDSKDQIEGLDHEQFRKYLKYRKKFNFPTVGVYLRSTNDRQEVRKQWLSDNVIDRPDLALFPLFKEALGKMPFLDLGKILLLVSLPFSRVPLHFDFRHRQQDNDQTSDGSDGARHFIWLNMKRKKFFVALNKEKHFLNKGRCFTFNLNDFHGSEMSPYTTISMRIDGQFQAEFCRQVGLPFKERHST